MEKHFGITFLERNQQHKQTEFCEGGQTAVQIGNSNRMDINIDGTDQWELIISNFGYNNEVIIHIQDHRQTEHLERRSDNELQHCRMVLRASPNEEWNQIVEDATKLDLDVLNRNPVLKENKISIEAIQKGCLVVCFNTANNVSLEESLYNLFSVMFEFLKIDSKLQKSDVSTFQVNGYIYIPENFKKGESLIFCHLSWSNTRTNCDIDVHVSVLMGKLIQHGFSSNVGERIELQIRYDVAMRHHSIKTDESWHLLTEALNQFPLILQNVDRFENNINLSFKCPGKMAYINFIERNGPIVIITKTFFETTSDSLVKLSVFLDTSFVPESVPDQGLVVYLRGLTDAAFTGNIFEIILKILRERRQSQLKNIRELKIRANIEDDEGKGKSPGKSEMLYSLEDKQRFSKDLLLASQKGNLDLVKELLKKGKTIYLFIVPVKILIYK
uniref:Uncharacterized protein LOC111107745 n=1 Tax=Crassostrea virginica TaxID=6565 RepID=A0A8B8B5W4_CRAVI|nr:uncharacterized protein LOC111107745 [Crassostrea virginica]